MSIGLVFFVIALVFFFLDGVGTTFIPKMVTWGLFALTLGMLLGGVPVPWIR